MIQICNAISPEKLVSELIEIDALAFPEHIGGTCTKIYEKYAGNDDMFVLMYDDSKLIGYICFFPISETLCDKMLRGKELSDSDMSSGMIDEYNPHSTYCIYASTVAIIPEYQGRGLAKRLVKELYRKLLDKRNDGMRFASVVVAAATNGGVKIAEKMGLKKTRSLPDGYELYVISGNEQIYNTAEKYVNEI
jgi:GNAT superfamily N-acetyltransferase